MKQALILATLFASLMAARAQDFGATQTFLTDIQIVPILPPLDLDSSFGVEAEMLQMEHSTQLATPPPLPPGLSDSLAYGIDIAPPGFLPPPPPFSTGDILIPVEFTGIYEPQVWDPDAQLISADSSTPGDGSSVSTVPEPSSMALAGLGAVVLGARFWRRR